MFGGGVDNGAVNLAVGLLELDLVEEAGRLMAVLLLAGLGDHCPYNQNRHSLRTEDHGRNYRRRHDQYRAGYQWPITRESVVSCHLQTSSRQSSPSR